MTFSKHLFLEKCKRKSYGKSGTVKCQLWILWDVLWDECKMVTLFQGHFVSSESCMTMSFYVNKDTFCLKAHERSNHAKWLKVHFIHHPSLGWGAWIFLWHLVRKDMNDWSLELPQAFTEIQLWLFCPWYVLYWEKQYNP